MVSRPRAALDREFASAQGNWQPYRHSVGSGNYGLLRMMLGNGEIMCNATQSEQYPLKFIVFLHKIYTHADSRCFLSRSIVHKIQPSPSFPWLERIIQRVGISMWNLPTEHRAHIVIINAGSVHLSSRLCC